MINLKDITQETKTATLDYPGYKGFKVKVNLITRPMAQKIHRECMEIRMTESGVMQEQLNEEKFASKFINSAVTGWEGLTGAIVKELMPVDEKAISDEDLVPYSQDNALMLGKNCDQFDKWLNEVVFKLRHFRRG
jgi:hypothetical protein